MSRARRWLWVACVGVLLAGCAGEPVPVERFYRPDVAVPAARTPLRARILVESFDAAGVYGDRALVFRGEDGTYRQYHYHSWIEAPSNLLRDSLADYLRTVFGAGQVFTPQARVDGDVRLRARLRHLDQLRDGAGSRAGLGLEVVLSDRDDELLGTLNFDESEACAGAGPGDCQQADAALLGRAYAQIADLIDAKARKLPAQAGR